MPFWREVGTARCFCVGNGYCTHMCGDQELLVLLVTNAEGKLKGTGIRDSQQTGRRLSQKTKPSFLQ